MPRLPLQALPTPQDFRFAPHRRAQTAKPGLALAASALTLARISLLLCLLLGTALGCRPATRPDGGTGLLPLGALAPDATGQALSGPPISIHSQRGRAVVVYFYPKDSTPGCTREACGFRDAFAQYADHGVTVFGVSQDSADSHTQFAKQHQLPFPLVADLEGKVAQAYGVGSTLGFSSRVTFLISPTGRVAQVWPDVDPGVHAAEVLRAIEANGFSKSP